MGKKLSGLDEPLIQFIENQKMFFVGTAGAEGRVNVSPKGMDSLRVVNSNEIVWVNYTGDRNESAAHVFENSRMTLMFCSFSGKPLILRVFGQADLVHPRDDQWPDLIELFPQYLGARQIFLLRVDLVMTSCGYSVPFYEFVEDRTLLRDWAGKMGPEDLKKYWQENNVESIDGKPTNLFGDSPTKPGAGNSIQ